MMNSKNTPTAPRVALFSDPTPIKFAVSTSSSSVRRPKRKANKRVENAIYSHIRAVRALGRKEVNTIDIADALSLSIDDVNHAIASLRKKGVRVMSGR